MSGEGRPSRLPSPIRHGSRDDIRRLPDVEHVLPDPHRAGDGPGHRQTATRHFAHRQFGRRTELADREGLVTLAAHCRRRRSLPGPGDQRHPRGRSSASRPAIRYRSACGRRGGRVGAAGCRLSRVRHRRLCRSTATTRSRRSTTMEALPPGDGRRDQADADSARSRRSPARRPDARRRGDRAACAPGLRASSNEQVVEQFNRNEFAYFRQISRCCRR